VGLEAEEGVSEQVLKVDRCHAAGFRREESHGRLDGEDTDCPLELLEDTALCTASFSSLRPTPWDFCSPELSGGNFVLL
jgi:hypothetical protein